MRFMNVVKHLDISSLVILLAPLLDPSLVDFCLLVLQPGEPHSGSVLPLAALA
jgi:hypothetical protein